MLLSHNPAVETAKLLSIVEQDFKNSGMKFTPWCQKNEFHISRMRALLTPERVKEAKLHSVLTTLIKLGVEVKFCIEVPGLEHKTTSVKYESLVDIKGYIQSSLNTWATFNKLQNKDIAKLCGIPTHAVSAHMAAHESRSTLLTIIRDFAKAGFKFHCDLSHPNMDLSEFPKTIDDVLANKPEAPEPSEVIKNSPAYSSDEAQRIMSGLVIELVKAKYKTVVEFARKNKLTDSTAWVYTSPTNYPNVSVETFMSVLNMLGAKLTINTVIGNYRDEAPYSQSKYSMNLAIATFTKSYLKNKDVSLSQVASMIKMNYSLVLSRLAPTKFKAYAISTVSELVAQIGITVSVTIEHSLLDRAVTVDLNKPDTPLVEKVDLVSKVVIEDGKPKIKTPTKLLDFLDDRTISNMYRGQVKTSMGETIRPFL